MAGMDELKQVAKKQHLRKLEAGERDRRERDYFGARLCENGHLVSAEVGREQLDLSEFCSECGEATISRCTNSECRTRIEGLAKDNWAGERFFEVPSYCRQCGQAYPWYRKRKEAFQELLAMNDEETAIPLADCFDSLVNENPDTPVAIERLRRWMKAAEPTVKSLLTDILKSIAVEKAKRVLLSGDLSS